MPLYQFRNKETGDVTDEIMSIAKMETYLESNPNMELYHSTPPVIGDTVRLGIRKPDSNFRDLLGHIKKQHRSSTINNF